MELASNKIVATVNQYRAGGASACTVITASALLAASRLGSGAVDAKWLDDAITRVSAKLARLIWTGDGPCNARVAGHCALSHVQAHNHRFWRGPFRSWRRNFENSGIQRRIPNV
jgi:hypothetical protein